MKHQTIKDQLYKLINKSENEFLLEMVYEILSKDAVTKGHSIQLSDEQENELLQSYNESLDESNLVDIDELRNKKFQVARKVRSTKKADHRYEEFRNYLTEEFGENTTERFVRRVFSFYDILGTFP